jgi:hypothetical protein
VGAYLSNFGITQHIDATEMPIEDMERLGRAYASDQGWTDIRKATYPLKAGSLFLIDRPEAKPNYDAQFFIQVAIDEPGVFQGEPLGAVIWQGYHGIVKVISQFRGMY